MKSVLRETLLNNHSGKEHLLSDQSNINRQIDNQINDMNRQIGNISQTINEMTVNFNYTNTGNTDGLHNAISEVQQEVAEVKHDITNVNQDMNDLAQSVIDNQEEFSTHVIISDNNFSIHNVVDINQVFIKCINKLNFTLNLINEKKHEIITAGEYASVLRPIFEKKFTDNAISIDGYVVITTIEEVVLDTNKLEYIYFMEPDSNKDNKRQWNNNPLLNEQRYKADIYDETIELREKNPQQSMFYIINWYKWSDNVKVTFSICMPDILNPNGPWIRILSGFNITPYFPSITSVDLIPQSYKTYLKRIEDIFNMYVHSYFNPSLGTIYQFGPDSVFNTLSVVSSPEYPSWNNQLIINSYIPGSNINMPEIIYQINIQLNRAYTGMDEGEVVFVQYELGDVYYAGVVKMLKVNGYPGLCYQIQTVSINELFPSSVHIMGDAAIKGGFNVYDTEGEHIIHTNNTNRITTFNDKVGINQQSHEVKGVLDIHNLTQQTVLDLFGKFISNINNSYDIIHTIIKSDNDAGSTTSDCIINLFKLGNVLFDYKNQCSVFSIKIKAILTMPDINIIHDSPDQLGHKVLASVHTLHRLNNIVKEINQMEPEIKTANNPSYVFSSIELFKDTELNTYLVSLRSYISNSGNNLIFCITHYNVNYIVNDKSLDEKFTAIVDYASREHRFLNYAGLLFHDPLIIDTQGNYTTALDGSIQFQNHIRNNPYFSNRWNLLPESYLFSLNSLKNNVYMIMEGALQWSNREPIKCWNGDNNVQLVVDSIQEQNKTYYNNRKNGIFPVNYRWREGRKISFTNTMNVGENVYVIGSGFDMNSIINQTLLVQGDNTLSGNFYVSDSNNVNIFKIDNVNKSVTSRYSLGIGVDTPNTIVDIKDSTVSDLLSEHNAGRQQYTILNKSANKLYEFGTNTPFDDSTDFAAIVQSVYNDLGIEQTIENYCNVFEINLNTMLVDDIKVCNHWLYPHWGGKRLRDIQDKANKFSLDVAYEVLKDILEKEMLYHNGSILTYYKHISGWKLERSTIQQIGGKMYILCIGTNIQYYGLRPDTNQNIDRFMNSILSHMWKGNHIDALIKNINPINKIKNLNELRIADKLFTDIDQPYFIITMDINDIGNKTTYQDIKLNEDFTDIEFGEVVKTIDITDTNLFIKFKVLIANIAKNNYYNDMIEGNFNIIAYEDLYIDYIGGIKCIKKENGIFSLLLAETRVQQIVKPSLTVEGDSNLTGDLLVTNKASGRHYLSVDPESSFMGINTDERFINYSDLVYSTTDSVYAGKHNANILRESYPVMVGDRIQEDPNKINRDVDISVIPTDELKYFSTYSAYTAKRTSRLYTFEDIVKYATEYHKRAIRFGDNVTHLRYGPDMSFEVRDANDRTVEIGQLQMVIDRIDNHNRLRGGFGVQVNDPNIDGVTTFENSRRNLLYVDNDSQLFVQKINLNGGVLTTDDGTNLFWNGKKVNNLDNQDNQVNQVNLGGKLLTVNSDGHLLWDGKRVMTEQTFN